LLAGEVAGRHYLVAGAKLVAIVDPGHRGLGRYAVRPCRRCLRGRSPRRPHQLPLLLRPTALRLARPQRPGGSARLPPALLPSRQSLAGHDWWSIRCLRLTRSAIGSAENNGEDS
jgi:hypothetical protein